MLFCESSQPLTISRLILVVRKLICARRLVVVVLHVSVSTCNHTNAISCLFDTSYAFV